MKRESGRTLQWIALKGALWLAAIIGAEMAIAAEVAVTHGPRAFTVVAPEGWTRAPYEGDQTVFEVRSPEGKPRMHCDVSMGRAEPLKDLTQEQLNELAAKPLRKDDVEATFRQMFDEFEVLQLTNGSFIGGQLARQNQFRGRLTNEGMTAYVRGVQFTQVLVTGIVVAFTCQGMDVSAAEAQKAFDYWKLTPMLMGQSIKYLPSK